MKSKLERLSVVMAVVTVVAALIIGPVEEACCSEVIWETDYAFIHFDWSGTWDKEDYYAYGFYLLDIPDWTYLFSVYGMGWDRIWGPVLWGDDGKWDASDKIHIRFYYGFEDGVHIYHTYAGYVFVNSYYLLGLDLSSDEWIKELCFAGYLVVQEVAHEVYAKIAKKWWYDEVEYALALYIKEVLWPWQYYVTDKTLDYVRSQYQQYQVGYTTWSHATSNYEAGSEGPEGIEGYLRGYWTLLAWGFLLCDYDHYFGGNPNTSGATSIYRVAELLLDISALSLEAPKPFLSDMVLYAYGHTVHEDWSGSFYWLYHSTEDLNAYLYYLMWGHWFGV